MPRLRRKIRGPSKEVVVKRLTARRRNGEQRHASADARSRLEAALVGVLVRERSRMAGKHGPRSPEVERADAAVRTHKAVAERLFGDAQRARIVPPRPDQDTVVIHGRVVDAKLAGVAKIDVALVERNGKPLAHGRTDERGYFKLERPVEKNQPAERASVVLVISRGNDELHRRPVGDLTGGQVGYGEFVVKA